MKKNSAEPVLERLVAEVRREPLPDLDWDGVEESLFARLGEAPRSAKAHQGRSRSPFVLVLAAAAVAGVAAAAVGVVHHEAPEAPKVLAVDAPATEKAPRPRGAVNGNTLAVGAVIQAQGEPIAVEHQGHVTWTLEPDSAAHIEEIGGIVRVALDRGVLAARVVKSSLPESFVVRVEGTRIAVHGTAFRVVRLAHSVRVEVTEGVVGVGPLGGPSFDVAAPGTATTTLEGVRAARRHAARSVVTRGEAHAHPGVAENTEAASAEETAPAAPEPVAEEEETEALPPEAAASGAPQVAGRAPRASSSAPSIDGVVAAVRRCFRDQTVASGDLHISVSTQMSLRIQPSGRVGEAVFTPPLAPRVRRCVDENVGSLSFPSSADGFAVDRVLELER